VSTTPVNLTISIGYLRAAADVRSAHITAWGRPAGGAYGSLWVRDIDLPGTTVESSPAEVLAALSSALRALGLGD